MTNYNDIFKQAAQVTNETVIKEGGFEPVKEGTYELTITDVRFDPFKKGHSFSVDYETNDGQQGGEIFSINTKDASGVDVKESRLVNNVNRLNALIVAVEMAGILTESDFMQGDEKVSEALLPIVDLKFYSTVTHRTYEKQDGSEGINVNFTHEKNPID
ncbi:hypothetical protein H7198_06030 [Fructobacillus sp. CRL 2054]|uniref:hypothetical protein n=1 Tax=Fructobacillus sp. CRL 2054 TaxID=2763007 RepID=UPI00237918BC|nr:hypothetical protein [Fructobacillus sp. CRL 2054]MDD9139159.1 hypothetical protein [Fructobacillus sp. CRL 2054]